MNAPKIAILTITLCAIGAGLWWLPEPGQLLTWLESLRALGWPGALAFGGIYVLGAVLVMPASLLTIAAGFLFGLPAGIALISASSTLGATLAMWNGRYLMRDVVARRLEARPRLRAILSVVEDDALRIVALVRLSPLFPYNFTNYAFGLTGVRTRDFVLASWIAMLPGTTLYVSIGAAAGSLSELTLGVQDSPSRTGALVIGVIATVGVTALITRQAQAAIARLEDPDAPPSPP